MAAYSEMQPAGARENEEIRGEKILRTVTLVSSDIVHILVAGDFWQPGGGILKD